MANYQQQAADYASQQKAWSNQAYGWNGEPAPMNSLMMGPPPPPPAEGQAPPNPSVPSQQQWTASGYAHWNAYGAWQQPGGTSGWPAQYPYAQPGMANPWGYYYGAQPPPPPTADPSQAAGAAPTPQAPGFDESSDPDLIEFDKQFRTWAEKYDTWKEENKNHPDKESLASYEVTWKKWREDLLQKRDELKKTKMASSNTYGAIPSAAATPSTTEVGKADTTLYDHTPTYQYPPYGHQPPENYAIRPGMRPPMSAQHPNMAYHPHNGPPPNMPGGPQPYMPRAPPPASMVTSEKPPGMEDHSQLWPMADNPTPLFSSTKSTDGIPGLDIAQSESKNSSDTVEGVTPKKEVKSEKSESGDVSKFTFNRNIGPIGLHAHLGADPNVGMGWKPPGEWYEDEEDNETQGAKRDLGESSRGGPPSKFLCNKRSPDPNTFGQIGHEAVHKLDDIHPCQDLGTYRGPSGPFDRGGFTLPDGKALSGTRGPDVDGRLIRPQFNEDMDDRRRPEMDGFGPGGQLGHTFGRDGPPEGDRFGRGHPGDGFGRGGPQSDMFVRGAPHGGGFGPGESQREGFGRGEPLGDRYGRGGPPRDSYGRGGMLGDRYGRGGPVGDRYGRGGPLEGDRFGRGLPDGDRYDKRNLDDGRSPTEGDQFGRPPEGDRFGRGGPPGGDRFGRGGPPGGDRFGRGGPPGGDRFSRGGPPGGNRFGRGGPPEGDRFGRGGPPEGDRFGRGGPPEGDRFGRGGPPEGDRFGRGGPPEGDRFGRGGPPEDDKYGGGGPPGDRFGRGGPRREDSFGRGGPRDDDRFGRGGLPEGDWLSRGPSETDGSSRDRPSEVDRIGRGPMGDSFDQKVNPGERIGSERPPGGRFNVAEFAHDKIGQGAPLEGDRFSRGGPQDTDRFGRDGVQDGGRFGRGGQRGGPPDGGRFSRGEPPSGERANLEPHEGNRFGGEEGDRFTRGGPPIRDRFGRGGPLSGDRFGRGGVSNDAIERSDVDDRYGTGRLGAESLGRGEPEGDKYDIGAPTGSGMFRGRGRPGFGREGTEPGRFERSDHDGELPGRPGFEKRDEGRYGRFDSDNDQRFSSFRPDGTRFGPPGQDRDRIGRSTFEPEGLGRSKTHGDRLGKLGNEDVGRGIPPHDRFPKTAASEPYARGMKPEGSNENDRRPSYLDRQNRQSDGGGKTGLLATPPPVTEGGYRGFDKNGPPSHLLDRFGRAAPGNNRATDVNKPNTGYNRPERIPSESMKSNFNRDDEYRGNGDKFDFKAPKPDGRMEELMKMSLGNKSERHGGEHQVPERKPREHDRFERSDQSYKSRSSNDYSKYEDPNRRGPSSDRFSNNRASEQKSDIVPPTSRDNTQPPSQNATDKTPAAPPVEVIKGEKVSIDDIISVPGRFMRPPKLVIILRGLPGSGKTTMAKMIKNREIENGGSAPRILCLDDYFMVEVEKMTKDEETGRTVKTKAMEYEYEPELEERYRAALIKSFKKQVDEKFFPFIIVDCVHSHSRNYMDICDYAQKNEFEPYIAELDVDMQTCVERNAHGRQRIDIQRLSLQWELSPAHITQLDLTSYMQDADIQEVEMEDCMGVAENDVIEEKDSKEKLSEDDECCESFTIIKQLMKSKWDADESQEDTLNKLDGVRAAKKKMGESKPQSIEDWLQLSKEFDDRNKLPGTKRVRWADIEERKKQENARERGFVLGQTDWQRMTDPSMGSSALVQVKYI